MVWSASTPSDDQEKPTRSGIIDPKEVFIKSNDDTSRGELRI